VTLQELKRLSLPGPTECTKLQWRPQPIWAEMSLQFSALWASLWNEGAKGQGREGLLGKVSVSHIGREENFLVY